MRCCRTLGEGIDEAILARITTWKSFQGSGIKAKIQMRGKGKDRRSDERNLLDEGRAGSKGQ